MTILHTFMSPQWYVQGPGALEEAGVLIRRLGTTAFVLHAESAATLWSRRLAPALGTSREYKNCDSSQHTDATHHPATTAVIVNRARALTSCTPSFAGLRG